MAPRNSGPLYKKPKPDSGSKWFVPSCPDNGSCGSALKKYRNPGCWSRG